MSQFVTSHRTLEALLLAFAFAVAHTQSPLYYSNQNQYLLHGAAMAHHGHLSHDWLANTHDPTPLFSTLVAAMYSVHPWLLQVAYFLLLMGYFLAARWLIAAVPNFPDTRAARISVAALFTVAHAAILRWASVQLTGTDYPWYFQSGLASQYMLGPGIQPSAFGVLLLVAVAAFANGKPVLACATASLACVFHSTYLLPAGLLILGFIFAAGTEGRGKRILLAMAGISAVFLLISVVNVLSVMSLGADSGESLRILAEVRIPHHCAISRWFDWIAGLQLVWIAIGCWWCLRSLPLGLALFIAISGSVIFTLIQLVTGSHLLALAFPWRISVLLVPVATAVIIAKLLAWKSPSKWSEIGASAVLFALAVSGIAVTVCGLGYRTVDEHELYDYIRATATPNDVYLLPVQFPKVGSGRGAVSNTFSPPPRAKEGTNQIPVDLQRFRLETGACIYVDFKSVPYAAAEVEEWYRRMQFAGSFAGGEKWNAPDTHAELKREGITHVVWPRTKPLTVNYLEQQHTDEAYIIYRVK